MAEWDPGPGLWEPRPALPSVTATELGVCSVTFTYATPGRANLGGLGGWGASTG